MTDLMNPRARQIRNEGKAAFQSHGAREDNPYIGTPEEIQWYAGYDTEWRDVAAQRPEDLQ